MSKLMYFISKCTDVDPFKIPYVKSSNFYILKNHFYNGEFMLPFSMFSSL